MKNQLITIIKEAVFFGEKQCILKFENELNHETLKIESKSKYRIHIKNLLLYLPL